MRNIFSLKKGSIRQKLYSITLAVTIFTLLIFTVGQLFAAYVYTVRGLEQNLSVTAQTMGFQSAVSLEFYDSISAEETLIALQKNDDVIKGCLYDIEKKIFASYSATGEPCNAQLLKGMEVNEQIFKSKLYVVEPITARGDTLGYLYLENSFDIFRHYAKRFLTVVLGLFALALILAYRFIVYFERFLTKPVASLLNVVNQVSETNNYELRAKKISNDEVGQLVVGFNKMLHLIQLHNENLEKEKKRAEFANNAKTEFLSNMSHEIRTPLNGIIGTADLLQRSKLTEEDKKSVEIIAESGKNLLAIINDVLDISKIEAGKIHLDLTAVDLKKIIQSVVSAFSAMAKTKKIELKSHLDESLDFHVMVDEVRVRQVLTNLLSNAIKFTEKGEVNVHLEHVQTDDQGYFKISVLDTGIGISADKLDSIFSRFTQEDGSISRMYGGTGLGLSICKELVDLMHGKIEVETNKGKGSKFVVTLPLKKVDKVVEKTPSEQEKRDVPKLKVLVAEDDMINQKIIEKMLKSLGHEVHLADNGEVALEHFKEDTFDIVLMDMQMPVMNGIDSAKAIRAHEQESNLKETPILALTANALEQHKEMCYEAGMNGYYTKPITMKSIEEMLTLN